MLQRSAMEEDFRRIIREAEVDVGHGVRAIDPAKLDLLKLFRVREHARDAQAAWDGRDRVKVAVKNPINGL